MKLNVIGIFRAHFRTLRDADKVGVSYFDVFVFYVVPLSAGFAAIYNNMAVKNDAYNISITFFGIFIALLLNIQVAIFSIFQRKWDLSSDKRVAANQSAALKQRRTLLSELNVNLSYLVLICCIALLAALVFYVGQWTSGIAPAVMVVLFLHFMLTLLMIIKRSHGLFQKEYVDSPSDHSGAA